MTEAGPQRRWIGPTILAIAVVWAWIGLDVSADRLARAFSAARILFADFWPPQIDNFPVIWDALVETVQIAVLATFVGVALSIPLGLMAARTVFPPYIATPLRLVASAIRVLPSLLWALLAVIIVGPGPLAGVVALSFYSIGYLAKLQSEAIEGIPRDALDAVRAMGAPRWQQAWHVVLPESANALRSQALFMFEYNVRNSSVIGFVGAGGIGVELVNSLQFWDYGRAMAILLVLFATVALVDGMSYLIRRRYMELEERRASWGDVLRLKWRDE